jgi:hypothetical protein
MKFDFNLNRKSISCISSRFDRFNIFFPLWLKNAINYKIDIVILIDKITKNNDLINYIEEFKKKHINSNINVVDVSNYGDINKINNVHFFSAIFDRLYKLGYKNIVYTDPDELLLTENLEVFFKSEENHFFSQGFESVHNLEVGECDFSNDRTFLEQRNYGVWFAGVGLTKETSSYSKLTIYKNGFFPKTRGRHATEYKTFKTKNKIPYELYTFHLREMDINTMVENYKKSIELYSFCRENLIFETVESAKNRLYRWFMPNIIEIPDEIKKIIKKHNL